MKTYIAQRLAIAVLMVFWVISCKIGNFRCHEYGVYQRTLSKERELRYAVVSQLASRDEPAAVDKLIEIAKSGTDPQVRRQAIAALARKNDPRTTKLLLDLVEKP